MPAKSTEQRLMHCDEYVYTATPDTILYKLVDALCGTTGAGALVNEIFLARMGAALQTIYFNELDFIFGKVSFLARSPAESYTYNPLTDQLTSDQWSVVRTKDAWYRARIVDFWKACALGGTPDGIRMAVNAAVATDCDIFEVWRYKDNFGITENLGRAPVTSRSEVVVRPHKSQLAPEEIRLVRDMLDRICPMETIITVNTEGLAVISPIHVNAATSDSEYYEVQKMVTATPALAQLPAPEMLPIDLLPSQTWLYDAQTNPTLAPYAAFNISAEYGYYYLMGGGSRSPIDSVTYGTIDLHRPAPVTVYEISGSQIALPGQNIWQLLVDEIDEFILAILSLFVKPPGIPFTPLLPGPSSAYFKNNLDPDAFNYVGVPWPATLFPLDGAISTTTAKLISLIQNTPGPFVLLGTGEGAIVASNVYDTVRNGVLSGRASDLVAGVTFANPRRQANHTAPSIPDPGGHGVTTPNLANTDTFWWDFAAPHDPMAAVADDADGTFMRTWFAELLAQYNGYPPDIISFLWNAPPNIMTILNTNYAFYQNLPNNVYGAYHPIPSDPRPAYEIALAYIQSFAGIGGIVTGTDAMATYRAALNFQVFDTTGQYTAAQVYATADSPDNYPGGKYGIHPSYAPALNPDGSAYIFPYASQAAYVGIKAAQVEALGGLATPDSYQLPVTSQSSSAQTFTPDQSIAYFPPAKDSTVSTSITQRRSTPITLEVRDPANFQRSS